MQHGKDAGYSMKRMEDAVWKELRIKYEKDEGYSMVRMKYGKDEEFSMKRMKDEV